MKRPTGRVSIAEAERLAIKQHQAVCRFLNRKSITGQLTELLSGSRELVLLNRLLQVHRPITCERDPRLREEFGLPSKLSAVVRHLNGDLEKFSREFDRLKKDHVRITIPSKTGGLQLGKYLVCEDLESLEYLDGPSTEKVLSGAWTEFSKKRKGRTQRKRSRSRPPFRYLRPIEDVLRIGQPEEPRWFRKTGPIAADFDDGRVYLREDRLKELEALIQKNPVTMLEGVAATGKTVLALSLAYRLHQKGRVYYFDCDKKRDFDECSLVDEIHSAPGSYFILENIHLVPERFQSIYSAFRHNTGGHILFTARPSFWEFQSSRSESLEEIEAVTLEPFEQVDAVIEKYCSPPSAPETDKDVRQQIKDACADSLWLLSYALQGFVEAKGKGDVKGWLERGVKEDLHDLKIVNPIFPEALVAISPLYRKEVLTAESYLIAKLGFDYEVLDRLVRRGEITCQKTNDGVVFYGLPHSALAEVYWDYGQEYARRRGIPGYEDFIYDYAKSGMPNSMDAVLRSVGDARESVSVRLGAHGELPIPIQSEKSAIVVQYYLEQGDSRILAEPDVITSLARKIEEAADPWWIPLHVSAICQHGMKAAQLLWDELDRDKLANNLTDSSRALSLIRGIDEIIGKNEMVARELCLLLDPKSIADILYRADNVGDVGMYVSIVLRASDEMGSRLWAVLDRKELAGRASAALDIGETALCIDYLRSGKSSAARELCDLVDLSRLAATLNNTDEIDKIGGCVSEVLKANQRVGLALWAVCGRVYADKVNRSKDIGTVLSCVADLEEADSSVAVELCQLLDLSAMADSLGSGHDIVMVGKCISRLHHVSPETGQRLWEVLDREILAAHLSRVAGTEEAVNCLRELRSASPEMGRDICGLLDLGATAAALDGSGDLAAVGQFIAAVHDSSKETMMKLGRLIDKQCLASKLSRPQQVWRDESCIADISKSDSDMAREVCDKLDIEVLSKTLSMTDDVFHAADYFCNILSANRGAGERLWRHLESVIAVRLSSDSEISDTQWFIATVCSADSEMGRVLCSRLDLERLAQTLDEAKNAGHVGRLVSEILHANEQSGRRLWGMLDKDRLATKLRQIKDLQEVKRCVDPISCADSELGREVCHLLDMETIATHLGQEPDIMTIVTHITTVFKADPERGKDLWSLLDKPSLATKFSQCQDIVLLKGCISGVRRCDPRMARELCSLLNLEHMATKLGQGQEGRDKLVQIIGRVDRDVARRLREQMDK